MSPSANGEVLADRFRVVRLIARGGMGEVYQARDFGLKAEGEWCMFRSGGPEIFVVLVIAAMWLVPVAAAVWVIMTLNRLRSPENCLINRVHR